MRRLLVFSLSMVVLAGYADDPITLLSGDANGTTTSFNGAGHWSDGQAPHEGADYLVALGTSSVIRTPATDSDTYSTTFKGDSLALGVVDGAKGKMIHKSRGNCVITHNNLILANGQYAQGEGGTTATVKGTATVTSPESTPFQIQGSGNSGDRKFLWNVAMTGEVGTMFEASRTSGENSGRFLCFLGGDNTGYFGKMQANGANIYLGFSNTKAVGGPLETWTPDAIKLINKGVLSAADTDGVVIARENGGITADDSGCVLFVGNAATFKATFQMPIVGGPMTKQGVGIAFFDAAWDAGDLTVAQGSFSFTQAATVGASCSAYTVAQGCSFSAYQEQLDGKTLSSEGIFNPAGIGTVGEVTLGADHQVTELRFDVSGTDADAVTLTDAASITAWPMKIGLAGYGRATRYPVLKIPTAVKTVVAEDFVDTSVADPLGLVTSGPITVETDAETGMQTVFIGQSLPIINQIVNDKFFTDAAAWEDGAAAHAGAAYVTYAKLLRSSGGTDNDVTFPGDRYYIYGISSSRADFRIKDRSVTMNDMRMGQKTIITGGAGSSGTALQQQTLYGNVTISAPSDMKANFATEQNRTFIVAATLHGTGCACATAYGASTLSYIHLTADNSDFTGTWQIGDNETKANAYPVLHISSKANLGGNPASRQADGLRIYNYGVLAIDESLTLDDPNRVVHFNNGFVDIPEDKTLTILSETSWVGNATKLGKGTLAMGTSVRTSNSKNMMIQEGFFKPLTVETVGSLQLTFSDGSGYRIDKDPEDPLLAEFGLLDGHASAITLADGMESLPVVIDLGDEKPHGTFTVPLFTLVDAAADVIRGKITVTTRPKNYAVSVVEETVTWTNSSGEESQRKRFSASFIDIGGTVILLR
ncbi:MAG: hypothetical protein J6334_06555 [Kiritimatiellae bacterium]|nr:hypothetical protein [Kiritimatiellia bacterium]